jgi:thiamine-phosphate pyrophosphorylase
MFLPKRLIALSTGELRSPRSFPSFLSALDRALDAGLPGVLLREPNLGAGDYLRLAEEVQRRCAPDEDGDGHAKAWFGIHDSVHVALRLGANGVHLGFRSLPTWEVRDLVGDSMAIGFSTHAGEDSGSWRGADYLFHGPVHATPSKAGVLDPIGIDALAEFCARADLPVYGLGGIGPDEVNEVASRSAGVAAMGGILGAADPGAATRAYLDALGSCTTEGSA